MAAWSRHRQRVCGYLSALAIAMTAAQSAIAHAGDAWQVQAGTHAAIELNGKKIKLAQSLSARLKMAEDAAFLPFEFTRSVNKHARWLVVRASSTSGGGDGFCGAGYEDHLVLVEVVDSTARCMDEFQAQSCLQSIGMDVDQFDELLKALVQDPEDGSLAFKQSRSNERTAYREAVSIKVMDGRMRLETQRTDASD